MVYLLYDMLLFCVALVLVPSYFLLGFRGSKTRQGFRERLGFYPAGQLSCLKGRRVIWVHAVSVGEVKAAVPLLRALKQSYPEHALVMTCMTLTGQSVARKLPEPDLCLLFPFDLSFVVRSVLRRLSPDLLVIIETEIWPNLLRQARRMDIPVILANGRISERSFPRYLKGRLLLAPVLQNFSAFSMQSEEDVRRIQSLGAPVSKISVSGNLKFEIQADPPAPEALTLIRQGLRLPKDVQLFVAGSTHAGEESDVLDAYSKVLETEPNLVLILVPRHPERCPQVAELLLARGVSFVLRSELDDYPRDLASGMVLLVDSMGEMVRFYSASDVVFVGGSLVPVGGHNILEAARVGKPVLFGPHMENSRDIVKLILAAGAGEQVAGVDELAQRVQFLLSNSAFRTQMGQRGARVLEQHSGATRRTLEIIGRFLQ